MPSLISGFLAGLGLFAELTHGQLFTLDCAPLITERGDPILSPGLPSPGSHVHAVVGGTGFNLSMTPEEAPSSKNTTCSRQLDHSDYWQPQLYTYTDNNTVKLIPFQGASVFYFNRACDYAPGRTQCPDGFKAQAPPAGLRIIVGNSTFRRPQYNESAFVSKALKTVCLRNDGNSASYPGLPLESCDRMMAESYFPSCWNGKDIDSDDHFKHVAFPVNNYKGGVCPETHPVAIYSVFYQFFYDTKNFPEWQKWLFSTGDVQGYSLHGDFLQGWTNQTALEQAVYTCDGSNGPDKAPCSVADGIQRAISMPPELPGYVEEIGLTGKELPSLPGIHPIAGSYEDRLPALK